MSNININEIPEQQIIQGNVALNLRITLKMLSHLTFLFLLPLYEYKTGDINVSYSAYRESQSGKVILFGGDLRFLFGSLS